MENQEQNNGVKQLRSIEGIARDNPSNLKNNLKYKEFKNKMRHFAERIIEAFINEEYKMDQNIVISPLSIELCLGLAIGSSSGVTREELLNAFDLDYLTFKTFYKYFYNENFFMLNSFDSESNSHIIHTNSVWINNDAEPLDSGLNSLKNDYYCNCFEADFKNNNQESSKAISDFINKSTKGYLKPSINLSPDTLIYLMNTLYAKDVWNERGFDLGYSRVARRFINADGSFSMKPLLDGKYHEGKTLAKEKYFSFYTDTENGFRLYFIKPKLLKTVKEVLSKETIEYALDSRNYIYKDDVKLEKYYTKCIFPEYSATMDINLKEVMTNTFNVKTLFNKNCDFSNLCINKVFPNEIRHMAKLDVNKKGIEGGAITYSSLDVSAGPSDYRRIYFDFLVDKEFIFILTWNDNIVFGGVVTNIDK